jgi:hypothetical protein
VTILLNHFITTIVSSLLHFSLLHTVYDNIIYKQTRTDTSTIDTLAAKVQQLERDNASLQSQCDNKSQQHDKLQQKYNEIIAQRDVYVKQSNDHQANIDGVYNSTTVLYANNTICSSPTHNRHTKQ